MVNIIKKHSIKQILIASLCTVSALTFSGDGNLRQPLLAGSHADPLLQAPVQVGMGIQQPIQIIASTLSGLTKTLDVPANTTMQELYQHHLIPLFSNYNFPSSKLIRESKPGCPSCCDRYVAIIDNTEYPIRWYVKREDIHNLNALFNDNNQQIADQPIINLSHHTILPYRHDMLISDALPIANDNTAQILVNINKDVGEDVAKSVMDFRHAERVFLVRINKNRCEKCVDDCHECFSDEHAFTHIGGMLVVMCYLSARILCCCLLLHPQGLAY